MSGFFVVHSQKFHLGELYLTAGASSTLSKEEVELALNRHAQGDWGDVCQEDKEANESSLQNGSGFQSVYQDRNGITFWIITEADRSVTTVLLPDEY